MYSMPKSGPRSSRGGSKQQRQPERQFTTRTTETTTRTTTTRRFQNSLCTNRRFSWADAVFLREEDDEAAPTKIPMFLVVCESCEEDDEAAPTKIPIFLVVWESHEADWHSCIAWGADDLCEFDFDMQDSTNEWESLGDKASGESESRDVGELLHLHINLSVRYHLPE